MDFGRQVGSENPIRSDQIRSDQVRSGQSTARQGKTKLRQVSQAKSVRSGQAAKAGDHFRPISPGKGGVHPTYKDVSCHGKHIQASVSDLDEKKFIQNQRRWASIQVDHF